jgi:hypothetical protein
MTFHNEFEWFAQNIKTNTYVYKDHGMMNNFVESMQLQALWEWARNNEPMWHVLWLGSPFED